jgi:hypothetical protein
MEDSELGRPTKHALGLSSRAGPFHLLLHLVPAGTACLNRSDDGVSLVLREGAFRLDLPPIRLPRVRPPLPLLPWRYGSAKF